MNKLVVMISSSNSSKGGWIASQNAWIRANVDVSPNVSFSRLSEVVSNALGEVLEPTDRYDEFPGMEQRIDRHDVTILGMPRSDAVEPDWVPSYSICIFPDYPEKAWDDEEECRPKDVTEALIELLAPLLPECKLTAG